MRLPNYIFALSFVFSTVSSNDPLFPERPRTHFSLVHSQMNVNCAGRIYTAQELNDAAIEACSQYIDLITCSGRLCYYLKKSMPYFSTFSLYKGHYFKEEAGRLPLLKWPLPKREVLEKALIINLGPEGTSVKAIQKVKSEIAIVPTNEEHAEQLFGKSQTIISVLGGKVEKTEEWTTYVVDHVPRKLHSLEGKEIVVT
ncbi:hypothetical protein EPUL_006278, partial [Erysiphe pulchra]